MSHLLLVEDDSAILRSLEPYIRSAGHTLTSISDGKEAMRTFSGGNFDLIILDLNLPGADGFTVCEHVRKDSSVAIIILSARSSEDDRVRALDLGADDYVTKPFSPRELLARISAVLKRTQVPKADDDAHNILGNIRLDRDAMQARVDENLIDLTKTEFALLVYLIDRRWTVVDRSDMMKDVIGYDHYLHDRTIDTHMKNLRRKLGEGFTVDTIRGVGYRLN